MAHKIITITREYGSGGRLIAKKVAEALNIAFYDNELIDETARELGIDIDTIRKASQEKSSSFAYSLNNGPLVLPINDQVYATQAKIIKHLAEKEDCIIVNGCANYILEDYPDVYYRMTPKKIDDDYMAKPDKIREKAKEVLDMFNSYFYLEELKNASYYLDKNQLLETGIGSVLCLIQYLDEAIKEDDLVGMRRLSKNSDYKMKEFEKAYENLREINMEEERQISLFEMMM